MTWQRCQCGTEQDATWSKKHVGTTCAQLTSCWMHECKRQPVRNICNANELQTVHNFDKFMKPLVHVSLNQPPLTRQYSANSFFVFSQFNSTSTRNFLLLEILFGVLEIVFLLCSPNCERSRDAVLVSMDSVKHWFPCFCTTRSSISVMAATSPSSTTIQNRPPCGRLIMVESMHRITTKLKLQAQHTTSKCKRPTKLETIAKQNRMALQHENHENTQRQQDYQHVNHSGTYLQKTNMLRNMFLRHATCCKHISGKQKCCGMNPRDTWTIATCFRRARNCAKLIDGKRETTRNVFPANVSSKWTIAKHLRGEPWHIAATQNRTPPCLCSNLLVWNASSFVSGSGCPGAPKRKCQSTCIVHTAFFS